MHVHPPIPGPADILRTLRSRPRAWILPSIAGLILAAMYVLCRSPQWQASQILALRNEAANNAEGPGRFRQPEEMRITQETLLEVAKSQEVLRAAMREVGPPENASPNYPTAEDLADMRDAIALSPPKGTEFGLTEIIHLKVKSPDRIRAIRLVTAISKRLQAGLQQLRQSKAQSMIDELNQAAALAEADLQKAMLRVAALEAGVGGDLAELRMLELTAIGDSDLRRRQTQLEAELRETQISQRMHQELRDLLQQAKANPAELLATPHKLLESQPSLRKLKEGLLDAQMRTAQLLGSASETYPLVVAARASQKEIAQRLHAELDQAIAGVELDLRLAAARMDLLNAQLADLQQRLARLAAMRAEYSMLVSDMRHRTTLAEKAQKELADARAAQVGATSSSLITTVGRPEIGHRPLGPGSTTILLAGLVGGFLAGCGWIFLTATPVRIPLLEIGHSHEPLTVLVARQRRPHKSAQVLSLNEALLTLAQRETAMRRRT